MSQVLDHRHMIVTAYVTNPPLSAQIGEEWLRRLVKLVDMQILMDAKAIYCEDLGNEGVTGVVGLTTSHSSFHAWHMAERPFINFDLYSCHDFPTQVIFDHLKEFGAVECRYMVIDRNEGRNKVIDEGTHFIEEMQSQTA